MRIALQIVSLAVVFLVTGCDSTETQPPPSGNTIDFNGVTYEPVGNASLRVSSEGLVVENIGSSGNDGFSVAQETPVQRANFSVQEVTIPANGRWGAQAFGMVDGTRTALTTAWAETEDGETNRFTFDFAPEIQVEMLHMQYFLGGEVVFEMEAPNNAALRTQIINGGSGSDGPKSVHVIRDGGVLVVATDFGGDPPDGARGCTATLLTVMTTIGGQQMICTDYMQATPIGDFDFPDVESVEVTARSVDAFTVTDGSVN